MGPRWKALQAAAAQLDRALKGYTRSGQQDLSHRTLVHGDFKSANVVFTRDGSSCAAYDFQYVGAGWGMKDVVYMLCSSTDADVWEQHEEELLEHYHSQLVRHLHTLGKHLAAERYTQQVLLRHYKLCLMDYVRFMAGWGMWGNSSYAAAKCQEWLPGLKDLL
jgi:aminoglycoside phosphotransferase (APT) family kinase protein